MFREVQRFRQPWVWLLLSLAALVVTARLVSEGPSVGNTLGLGVVAATFLLFLNLKLEVETRPDALHLRYAPFFTRSIPYSEIREAELEPYPLFAYGGWGLRYSFTKGWAYTVAGNQGLRLKLRSGKTLYLGSQRPEELLSAINANR